MDVIRERLTINATASGWTLSGEIDAHTAPLLEEAVGTLPSGTGAVLVDIGDVSFIDSSGLRVLIGLAGRASDEGRTLRVEHPSPAVVRLAEITGLGEMFGLTDDEPES
jgi:anti-sigma B factor antagonist